MVAKILIVDDSYTDRMIIKNMLSDFNVITAYDSLEAMRQVRDNGDIDLIIIDLNMPQMNGLQVLNELKSNEKYNKLRTIVLTNYDELDNEIQGLKLGEVYYIRKPVKLESLRVRIEIHLELLRMQRTAELQLDNHTFVFKTLFDQAPIGIAISYNSEPSNNSDNSHVSINPMFEKIIGRKEKELINLGWAQITHPADLQKDLDYFKKLQSGEISSYAMDKRYIKPDGSFVWVNMIVAPLNLNINSHYNHLCLVQDITGQKAIESALIESERSKSVLLSNLPGMAYRCNYDHEWTMQFVSAGCFDLTGYKPESLINNRDLSFNNLIAAEYWDSLWKEWERIISQKLPFKYEYEIITATRKRKWILEMGEGIYDEHGNVEALEGIIIDITDRKEKEIKLKYLSEHDSLTGLYNRRYFEEILAQDAKSKANEKRAIIVANLSKINLLSLTYGFQYSEILINKLATALSLHCSYNCQLFQTYSNRFAYYIKGYNNKNELTAFCDVIIVTLESILSIEGIGGGIGVIEIDDNKCDAEHILKNVLIASENALSNPNQSFSYVLFDKEMEAKILREANIKNELTNIVVDDNNKNFYMHFQPILDLKTNYIYGFEALARLKSDKLGFVSPVEFIKIAEETKLIIPLGKKIMYYAFGFLKKLETGGYNNIKMSFNVSAIQLLRDDFNTDLINIIDDMKINASNLILEITESVFSDNYDEINEKLGKIKALGIKIAIDDFGTGYSSLAREGELNINSLKIDKYFIDKLLTLDTKEAITSDIISMAHKLGHNVIAEGVENEKQLKYLIENKCDCMQGFLFSKPIELGAAIELLKKTNTGYNQNEI